MIGPYFLPLLRPLWGKIQTVSDTYGITPLAYRIALTVTFLSAPAFMAVQMNKSGLIAFLLHFLIWAVSRIKSENSPSAIGEAFHVYGICMIVVFGTAFGVAGNYGMPIAFLFISWMVVSFTNLINPHSLQLIGGFEIGLSVVAMALFAVYIPAIAILFGLACLVSAGISFLISLKAKA